MSGDAEVGIVLGGSGQGEQISANKVHGVPRRAVQRPLHRRAWRVRTTTRTSLSIGARIVAAELADEITRIFLTTPFEGGRHVRRLEEITAIETEEANG